MIDTKRDSLTLEYMHQDWQKMINGATVKLLLNGILFNNCVGLSYRKSLLLLSFCYVLENYLMVQLSYNQFIEYYLFVCLPSIFYSAFT